MKKEIEIRGSAFGRVQGVGLRACVKSYAEKNGLRGIIKNEGDGSVSFIVQGNKDKIDKFIEWFKSGPGFSKVLDMKFEVHNINKKLKDFEIKTDYGFLEDKSRSFIKLGKSIFK